MAKLHINNVAVHYQDNGEGTPLVLVHGGTATSHYWDAVCTNLLAKYRTIALDLYGCGSTDAWRGKSALTHDEEAILVNAVMDIVDGPIHLIGHSYGAAVCLRTAISCQAGIRSLVLIEPSIYQLLQQAGQEELYDEICSFRKSFEDKAKRGEGEQAMELLVDRFSGIGTWKDMPEKVHQTLLQLVDPLIVGFAANAQNPTCIVDCHEVKTPTLLLYGDKTGEPEKAMVAILSQNLPHSRSVSISGAYHQSPISHPQIVARLITEHVSKN